MADGVPIVFRLQVDLGIAVLLAACEKEQLDALLRVLKNNVSEA